MSPSLSLCSGPPVTGVEVGVGQEGQGGGGESIARSRAPGQVPSGDVSPSSANIMGRLGKPTPSATTHSHSHVDLPVVVLYSVLIKILVR